MNLMLVAIFAAVGIGLFSKSFGQRTSLLVVCVSVVMTLLYFFRPSYMT